MAMIAGCVPDGLALLESMSKSFIQVAQLFLCFPCTLDESTTCNKSSRRATAAFLLIALDLCLFCLVTEMRILISESLHEYVLNGNNANLARWKILGRQDHLRIQEKTLLPDPQPAEFLSPHYS